MKSEKLKIVSIALSAFLAVGALAGCGNKEAESTASSVATESSAVASSAAPVVMETVKVWTNSGHTKELVTKMVEEYNNSQGKEKGIQIEYTVYSDNYQKTCELALASDQAPEIFKAQGQKADFVRKGDVIALEDMPGGPELLKNYDETLLSNPNLRVNGKTYGLPYNITNIKLLYNKDLFKAAGLVDEKGEAKPPKTWAEVAEYAKKLTNPAEKTYGIMLPVKWTGFFDWEVVNPFMSSIGHDLFNNKTGKWNFSDFKPAFDWLLKIKADKSYFPGAEGLDNDPARAQFAEGRVGMKMGANWDVGVLNNQFPAKSDWGAADIPLLDTTNRFKEFASIADWASISKMSVDANKEKVMEVYKWFHTDEMLAKFYEESKFIPYKNDIVKLATKEPTAKGWADFANIENVFIRTPHPSVKIEGDDYKQVMNKIWAGAVDVETALADLDKRYNAATDKSVAEGLNLKPFINENFDISVK